MSEVKPEPIADNLAGRPETEFPPATIPTIFADGVSSYAPGPALIKFYLYRLDPNLFGKGGLKVNPYVQVAMPAQGFAQTTALFIHAMKRMIAAGVFKQEDFDQMVTSIEQLNPISAEPAAAPNG